MWICLELFQSNSIEFTFSLIAVRLVEQEYLPILTICRLIRGAVYHRSLTCEAVTGDRI